MGCLWPKSIEIDFILSALNHCYKVWCGSDLDKIFVICQLEMHSITHVLFSFIAIYSQSSQTKM